MSEPAEGSAESVASWNFSRTRRLPRLVLAVLLFLVLAGLLLPLLNIGRYHRTIADSLTRSLAHTVHLGSVNLEIFPLPGLAIHDLTVEEDPSFGAEPLLHAPSVTVFLRLSSLWRQRLEISRISLDNASVNLARDPSGRWNFASLLLQASRTATAPTAQRRSSAAPRFPYIEFRSARINFKEGSEKKAFSFLNADASIWLADPNQWRIRFEAQPARTDLDLELEGKGTGTMRLDGSVTRATSIDQLPVKLHAEWTGAQLGQVSRLVLGSDSGWRGDLHAEADITGDMQNLLLQSSLRVADAHRQEFTPLNQLDIDTRCQATWHTSQQSLDNLTCLLPTGDGHLLLTGAVDTLTHPQPRLNLEINHTPVAFAVSILGLLRSSLPATLDASGTINGQFAWAPENTPGKTAAPENILTGHAVADTVAIRLSGMNQPVTFAALRFATPSAPAAPSRNPPHQRKKSVPPPALPANVILLQPAPLAAGAPTPMQVSGQFSRSGFSLHLTGESSLARIRTVSRNIGQLRAFANLASAGTAQTDMTFSGSWIPPVSAESSLAAQGSLRLQHAQLKPAWLPEPIDITTATAQFGNQSGNQPGNANITWANVSVSVNGIAAKGSASYPAICNDPSGCTAQVNLDFPTLDAAALQSALLGAGRHGELVQAILSTVESPAPPWPPLDGTIHVGSLSIKNLKLNNVRAAISIRDNRVNILSLDAAALGGSAHVTGSVEAASDGPKYALNFTCTGVKLAEAAALFHEEWGTGSIDGQMNLNLHGYSALASTATGDFHWILNGAWPASPAGPTLLNATQTKSKSAAAPWTASGTIANQTLTLDKGPLQGTISFDRKVDLAYTRKAAAKAVKSGPEPVRITGTLADPVTETPSILPASQTLSNPQGN